MKTYCFDIDGTLCTNTNGDYLAAAPFLSRISHVNSLYNDGNRIILYTARGTTTGINWRSETEAQLLSWGLQYHELILGKPHYDLFVDDKALSEVHYQWESAQNLLQLNIQSQLTIYNLLSNDFEFQNSYQKVEDLLVSTLTKGSTVYLAGNGGSMSDCLHFSAELTGRFLSNRNPHPSVVLASNLSSLTAIANDFSYSEIFAREFRALSRPGDLLIALSTSGSSPNIVELINVANDLGIPSILLAGSTPSPTSPTITLTVPSKITYLIQQTHITILHSLAHALEKL